MTFFSMCLTEHCPIVVVRLRRWLLPIWLTQQFLLQSTIRDECITVNL